VSKTIKAYFRGKPLAPLPARGSRRCLGCMKPECVGTCSLEQTAERTSALERQLADIRLTTTDQERRIAMLEKRLLSRRSSRRVSERLPLLPELEA
jgi:hypothetical protein